VPARFCAPSWPLFLHLDAAGATPCAYSTALLTSISSHPDSDNLKFKNLSYISGRRPCSPSPPTNPLLVQTTCSVAATAPLDLQYQAPCLAAGTVIKGRKKKKKNGGSAFALFYSAEIQQERHSHIISLLFSFRFID
jgi:hypothetical protein